MSHSSGEPKPVLSYRLIESGGDDDAVWELVDSVTGKSLVKLDQPDLVKAFMAGYRFAVGS